MHVTLFHYILMSNIHQHDQYVKCTKTAKYNISNFLFLYWHVKCINKMLMSLIWSPGFDLAYTKDIQE